MINANNLQSELRLRLKKMTVGDKLSVRTWKGDRGFLLHCTAQDTFLLTEDGFHAQTLENLERQAVLKAVKPIARREFPRSNKLRLTLLKETP